MGEGLGAGGRRCSPGLSEIFGGRVANSTDLTGLFGPAPPLGLTEAATLHNAGSNGVIWGDYMRMLPAKQFGREQFLAVFSTFP